MKLRYTDGCTCTSLQVDEKEFNLELSLDERRNISKLLKEYMKYEAENKLF